MVVPTGKDLAMADDILSFTQEEVQQLKKEELVKALETLRCGNRDGQTSQGLGGSSSSVLEGKMDLIITEFRQFKTMYKEMETNVISLKKENHQLKEALMQHQRYLETLEADKRMCNVVMLGVPESSSEAEDEHEEDRKKITEILRVTECQSLAITSLQRLGKPSERRNRVLLIKLSSKADRDKLLASTARLKQAQGYLSKVYIKKDVHPLVRKEFSRLKEVEKREKEKAENQGLSVVYNANRREIIVDGHVVDQFRPMFFADRG